METYWCAQKNLDVNLNDGIISDLLLIQLPQSGMCCLERWRMYPDPESGVPTRYFYLNEISKIILITINKVRVKIFHVFKLR
jgi:hypothetical protein